jgi:kelch-like protein 2/3
MSQEYLMQHVEEEPLLKADLQCKDYIIEALKYHLLKGDSKTTFRTPRTKPRQPVGLPKVLLVVGGQAPKAIRSVECFDFKEEKWYQVAEMPTRRCRAGLAVLHGKVYAVGGFNGSLRVRTVDVYDAALDQWSTCDHMEARRSTLGVAVLGNCIYAVGGFDGSTGLNTAEMFDPTTQKWRSIAPMSTRRSSVGVGVLYGLLYAVGGYDGASRQCLSSVECYTPEIDCWTSVPDMGCRRSGAGVGVLEGILYAVGGHDGPQVRKSVEAYDPAKRMWSPVSDMTFCRRNAGVVALNGFLYVVGGDDGCSNLSSVEVYNPKTDAWTMLPSCMGIGRSYAGVAIIDKPIWRSAHAGNRVNSAAATSSTRYANCDENSNAEGAVGYDHQPIIYETIDPNASIQEDENIYETIEDMRQEGAAPPPPPAPPADEQQSIYDVNPDVPSCSTYGRIGNAYGRIDIIGHGIGRIERHLSSSCGSINSNHYALESIYGTNAADSTGRISKISVQWLLANKWLPLWIANTETGRDYRIIDFLLAQRADSEESLGGDHDGQPPNEQGPSQS